MKLGFSGGCKNTFGRPLEQQRTSGYFWDTKLSLFLRGKPVDLTCKAGYGPGGLVLMDNAFGGGLLEQGNSCVELLRGLFGLVFGQGRSDLFDHIPGSGLVVHVSESSDSVLPRPFDG